MEAVAVNEEVQRLAIGRDGSPRTAPVARIYWLAAALAALPCLLIFGLAQFEGGANDLRFSVSSSPVAVRDGAATGGLTTKVASVEAMIMRLAARLKDNPNDAEGWRLLGWSYVHTKRYQLAANAYARAAALRPDDTDIRSALNEALAHAAAGITTLPANAEP